MNSTLPFHPGALRLGVALLCCLSLSACKIIVDVSEGGRIVTDTGKADCAAGQTCTVDVENGSVYSEIFTAVPDQGFVFVGWDADDGYLCGGTLAPCALANVPPQLTDSDFELRLGARFETPRIVAVDLNVPDLFYPVTVSSGDASLSIFDAGVHRFGEYPNGTEYEFSVESGWSGQGCKVKKRKGVVGGEAPVTLEVLCSRAPVLSDISLSPSAPYTGQDITAEYTAPIDYDGDTLRLRHSWYVNEVLQSDITSTRLPGNRVFRGDTVRYSLLANDGVSKIESSSDTITVGDAPLAITIAEIPGQVPLGDSVQLAVQVSDPDDEVSQDDLELVFGPGGMSLDASGRLSWDANIPMVMPEEIVHFALKHASRPEELERFSLTVTNADQPLPIALAGIQLSNIERSIVVGQFDDDPRNELLMHNGSIIQLVEERDGGYRETWSYPLGIDSGQTVLQVLGADVSGDGVDQIYVLTEAGLHRINDRWSVAETVYTPEAGEYLKRMDVALDGPGGSPRMVIRTDSQLLVLDMDDWTLDLREDVPDSFSFNFDFAVGNVDADPALEAVLPEGLVFDLRDGALEWDYSGGFGIRVILADVDGDGAAEILGYPNIYNPPTLFSAAVQSPLWSLGDSGLDGVIAANIDDDPADELLALDRFSLRAFDASLTGYTALWEADHNVDSSNIMATGDVTGDGMQEVIWSSPSSIDSALVVASVDASAASIYPQLTVSDSFVAQALGPADTPHGLRLPTFLSPVYVRDVEERSIVQVDEVGGYTLSETALYFDRNRPLASTVADYDGDGSDELIAATEPRFTGSEELIAIQLADLTTKASWLSARFGGRDIKEMTARDVNHDGYQDLVAFSSDHVYVIDLHNQVDIFESERGLFTGAIFDVAADDLDGDGDIELVVGTRVYASYLLDWNESNSRYELQAQDSRECLDIEIIDHPDGKQIACLDEWSRASSTWRLFDTGLNELRTVLADTSNVIEAVQNPADSTGASLFVTEEYGDRIKLVSLVTGDIIWQSPELASPYNYAGALKAYLDQQGKLRLNATFGPLMFITL